MDNISREDMKRMEKNAEQIGDNIRAGLVLAAMTAGVGWASEKAFGSSLSADPSKSFPNLIKMAANVSMCLVVFYHAIK